MSFLYTFTSGHVRRYKIAITFQEPGCTDTTWEWRDWKSFLDMSSKSLKGVSKYVFEFSDLYPGQVAARKSSDGEPEMFMLLKDGRSFDVANIQRPIPIPAAGLSIERQNYRFKHVRKHVREVHRDVTCPAPPED